MVFSWIEKRLLKRCECGIRGHFKKNSYKYQIFPGGGGVCKSVLILKVQIVLKPKNSVIVFKKNKLVFLSANSIGRSSGGGDVFLCAPLLSHLVSTFSAWYRWQLQIKTFSMVTTDFASSAELQKISIMLKLLSRKSIFRQNCKRFFFESAENNEISFTNVSPKGWDDFKDKGEN